MNGRLCCCSAWVLVSWVWIAGSSLRCFPAWPQTVRRPGCGAPGLGLSYQAIGNLVAVIGIVWGIFAAISGRISDRVGHRKILIPAVLGFSLMSGFSGMVTGLTSLMAI